MSGIQYKLMERYRTHPKLVWMKPIEVLDRIPHPATVRVPASYDIHRRQPSEVIEKYFDKGSLESIRKGLIEGAEFSPVWIDYTNMWYGWPSHEGRHRALVAHQLGIESIPVIVIKEA